MRHSVPCSYLCCRDGSLRGPHFYRLPQPGGPCVSWAHPSGCSRAGGKVLVQFILEQCLKVWIGVFGVSGMIHLLWAVMGCDRVGTRGWPGSCSLWCPGVTPPCCTCCELRVCSAPPAHGGVGGFGLIPVGQSALGSSGEMQSQVICVMGQTLTEPAHPPACPWGLSRSHIYSGGQVRYSQYLLRTAHKLGLSYNS